MSHPEAYLFVLIVTLVLAVPIVRALHTLLALQARVLIPLLRIQTGGQATTLRTSAQRIDARRCPHCTAAYPHTSEFTASTFPQPQEAQ